MGSGPAAAAPGNLAKMRTLKPTSDLQIRDSEGEAQLSTRDQTPQVGGPLTALSKARQ